MWNKIPNSFQWKFVTRPACNPRVILLIKDSDNMVRRWFGDTEAEILGCVDKRVTELRLYLELNTIT